MGQETRYEDCRCHVAARLLKADLSFLDEDEGREEAEKEPILPESTVTEELPGGERMAMEVSTIDISILGVTPSEAPSGLSGFTSPSYGSSALCLRLTLPAKGGGGPL